MSQMKNRVFDLDPINPIVGFLVEGVMEPIASCLKHIHSPLYDRRLAIMILKKYSYGRRSFSENARLTKIKDERRNRQYEPEAQTSKESPNKEEKGSPRMGYPYVVAE
jgi:hypothetical protein